MSAFDRDTPTFAKTRQTTFSADDPVKVQADPHRVAIIFIPQPATFFQLDWVEGVSRPAGTSVHIDRMLELTPDKYGRLAAQSVSIFGTDANTIQIIEVFTAL